MSSTRRVVITGLGLVGPLGNDKTKFWTSLCAGQSGIRPISQLPVQALPLAGGGEAVEFTGHISEFGELESPQKKAIRKGLKVMCREIQMGVAACQLAFQDAQLPFDAIDRERTGVVYGCDYIMTNPVEFEAGIGSCLDDHGDFEFDSWAEQGLPKVTPLWLLKYLPNMPACHVAIYNDLRGPNNSITVREASANLALAEAYCTIERGHADAIVSGATGTRIHPIKSVHVCLQEEVAMGDGDPTKLSRPFDGDRTGVVVGEGAGSLLLEELDTAEKRGATPLAEVIGFGSSTVIGKNSVADRKTAVANAIKQALQNADLSADEVGHVNAHGVSTVQGDRDEAAGIQAIFGQRSKPVPVVALKSATGNTGAGSGAMELISSVMALQQGALFPTQNYETPDPECPLNVVAEPQVAAGATAVNVNVTAQGQASALVVRAMA